jgi:hypothetical protein
MSFCNRIALPFLAAVSLAFLVACGSSSNKATPPPTGGFSDSNFNGTYVFSFTGTDYTNSATTGTQSFFAVAGTLTANGSGGLSGTLDINDPELGTALGINGVQTGVATTGGNYKVTQDGRGTGTITVNIDNAAYQFGVDFVLTSNSHGLITRFDDNGTGSGTLDLQTSGVAQSALAGSYSFALSGQDSSGNPIGSVGTFTLDGSGNATGLQDFNDNGDSSSGLTNLSFASGSTVLAGTPGTSQLTTTAFGGLGFDVWVIDATHLKLIETDTSSGLAVAGDAYVSTGQSFPTGNLVFTMGGIDDAGSATPISIGGVFSTSAVPNTSGTEDVNDGGSVGQAPSFGVSYATTSGRTLLSLASIYNGGWPSSSITTTGTYTFAAYPFTYGTGGVGVVLLEVDNSGGYTAGTAFLQSSTTVAASQGYGLNLSGENSSGEVDMIAEFSTTSSGLNGLYDANNAGVTIPDLTFGTSGSPGSYAVAANGRGTLQVPLQTNSNSVIGTFDATLYTVDGSNVVFIETDTTQVGTGTFELQNASSSAANSQALPHFELGRPGSAARAMKSRQKK